MGGLGEEVEVIDLLVRSREVVEPSEKLSEEE